EPARGTAPDPALKGSRGASHMCVSPPVAPATNGFTPSVRGPQPPEPCGEGPLRRVDNGSRSARDRFLWLTSAIAELSREHLLDTAGRLSFERALDYLDRVSGRRFGDGWVHATVSGGARYRVRLTDEGAFSWDCDCSWAEEGNCCKHVVAVGLVHLYERE